MRWLDVPLLDFRRQRRGLGASAVALHGGVVAFCLPEDYSRRPEEITWWAWVQKALQARGASQVLSEELPEIPARVTAAATSRKVMALVATAYDLLDLLGPPGPGLKTDPADVLKHGWVGLAQVCVSRDPEVGAIMVPGPQRLLTGGPGAPDIRAEVSFTQRGARGVILATMVSLYWGFTVRFEGDRAPWP